MSTIDLRALRTPVAGLNLRPGTLGDQFVAPGTLLVFLRHLGCMFCREMVADLRAAAADAAFPPVVMVTQSPTEAAAEFFAGRWPEAVVVADPDRTLYTAFSITRANFGGLFGPVVWSCAVRAVAKGNTQAPKQTLSPTHGDPWLLSALFLMAPAGRVDWEQRARHAGERADLAAVPRRGDTAAADRLPSAPLALGGADGCC